MRAPLAQVLDPRRHALGVQGELEHVDRRLEQVRGDRGGQQLGRGVGGDQVARPVDDDGRERFMGLQQLVERLFDRGELGRVERALRVDGRVARGQQHPVALAERDVEVLGQVQDHLLAGLAAAGLHEAQVARRDARLEREVELAQAPARTPGLDQWSNGHLPLR
jgi:hypothetical protein